MKIFANFKSAITFLPTVLMLTGFQHPCFASNTPKQVPPPPFPELAPISKSIPVSSIKTAGIKNVILLIPDGTSIGAISLARWFSGEKNLAMDSIFRGLMLTNAATTPHTDSAPAATAMACGLKSNANYFAMSPSTTGINQTSRISSTSVPLATVLESAQMRGLATGIVATSQVQHATPAAFSAHTNDRNDYKSIAVQQVSRDLTVVLGGGGDYLHKDKRADGQDLISSIRKRNYVLVNDRVSLLAAKSSARKLWGIFAPVDLPYEIDRDKSSFPSLAEMTDAAMEVLSKNRKGFFLMVEGSKIDWAAHGNDPAALTHEVLAFDLAVKRALEFARQRKDTLVLVLPDHANGGLTMGDDSTNSGPDLLSLDDYLSPLKAVKSSNATVLARIKEQPTEARSILKHLYGIDNLSAEEDSRVKEAISFAQANKDQDPSRRVLGRLLSSRAHLGWTTGGHTAEEVAFGCWHPNIGKVCPMGLIQNTDVAFIIEAALGLSLRNSSPLLFANLATIAKAKGWRYELVNYPAGTPTGILSKGKVTAYFEANRADFRMFGEFYALQGSTIFSDNVIWVPPTTSINLERAYLQTTRNASAGR